MRPRRVIVLEGFTEHRAAILRFVLEARGYRPLTCPLELDARALIGERGADLVICGEESCVERRRREHPGVPILLLMPGSRDAIAPTLANALLCDAAGMLRVLEQIRLLTMRKRGPKLKARPIAKELPAETEAA